MRGEHEVVAVVLEGEVGRARQHVHLLGAASPDPLAPPRIGIVAMIDVDRVEEESVVGRRSDLDPRQVSQLGVSEPRGMVANQVAPHANWVAQGETKRVAADALKHSESMPSPHETARRAPDA